MTTLDGTVVRLGAGRGGWRELAAGPGEARSRRDDLVPSAVSTTATRRSLLTFAHLSDLHLCDHQSTARVPFLDRYADPDWPAAEHVIAVGAYRAQELMTAQVAHAMVASVNRGPSAEFAVTTGDLTDNAQANEMAWYLTLLDGGTVEPDSGDTGSYDGFARSGDPRFWHPDGDLPCVPTTRHGLPVVPGLLDAVRRPFQADGLSMPWYSVHGNHDGLVQGTVGLAGLDEVAVGGRRLTGPPAGVDVLPFLTALDEADPDAVALLATGPWEDVAPDARRRLLDRSGLVGAHLDRDPSTGPGPWGHGFTEANRRAGTAYYAFDAGGSGDALRCLVLDTVDTYGGWHGSLDEEQLAWLDDELAAADRARRLVLLFSHHPVEDLVNMTAPPGVRRVLAAELLAVLHRHPCVVAWFNGHTHVHGVTAYSGAGGGFWQVTTASAVDWPQQWRHVDVGRRDHGLLSFVLTVADHMAVAPWDGALDDPLALAALSRELAGNDWQRRWDDGLVTYGAGERLDRNVELLLPDPWHR